MLVDIQGRQVSVCLTGFISCLSLPLIMKTTRLKIYIKIHLNHRAQCLLSKLKLKLQSLKLISQVHFDNLNGMTTGG